MPDIIYAKKWIEHAQNDYDFAVKVEKHFWPKDLEKICYHCQQGTEKALKAVLAYNEVEIPKTHNIKILIDECKKYDVVIQMDKNIVKLMTDYAVLSRYPDNVNEWIEEDAKIALKYTKQTLQTIKQALSITEEK